MEINILELLINDQKEKLLQKDTGTKRDIDFDKYIKNQQIIVITGIRRSGKSTLLHQFSTYYKDFLYINFDDERLLNFTIKDFSHLMITFSKISNSKVIFIDEIQNIDSWERFVRRIHDEGYKIFITGSNAKLLSSELSTKLTGRYSKIELYPFSFLEFCKFQKVSIEKISSTIKAKILSAFDSFVKNGSFPEFLNYNDAEFLQRTYEDIIHRDIINRFRIKEVKSFKQIAHYIFSNFTGDINYNSLKNILGFKSATSVKNYIDYLEEAYLAFEMYKYDYSLKKQHINNKKIYVIDNGMRNEIAFSFSMDYGKHLENIIFIELKRRGIKPYFLREKHECDFIIEEKGKPLIAIQSCYNLNQKNMKREIDGLEEAIKLLGIRKGLILTYDFEKTSLNDNKKIFAIPVWKWLLNENNF
jgi:predicted AAA+ superfamily ATPase